MSTSHRLRRRRVFIQLANAAEGGVDPRKLYVRCLPFTVSEAALANYFSQFGVVTSARVVTGPAGFPPFGFVGFAESAAATHALSMPSHPWLGPGVEVLKSLTREAPDAAPRAGARMERHMACSGVGSTEGAMVVRNDLGHAQRCVSRKARSEQARAPARSSAARRPTVGRATILRDGAPLHGARCRPVWSMRSQRQWPSSWWAGWCATEAGRGASIASRKRRVQVVGWASGRRFAGRAPHMKCHGSRCCSTRRSPSDGTRVATAAARAEGSWGSCSCRANAGCTRSRRMLRSRRGGATACEPRASQQPVLDHALPTTALPSAWLRTGSRLT